MTQQIFSFPGVVNIQRYGWWKAFAPENYHYGTWSTKTTQEDSLVWQVGHGMEFQVTYQRHFESHCAHVSP